MVAILLVSSQINHLISLVIGQYSINIACKLDSAGDSDRAAYDITSMVTILVKSLNQ